MATARPASSRPGQNCTHRAGLPTATRLPTVRGGSLFTFGEESLGNVSTSTLAVVTLGNGRVTSITGGGWLDTNPVWMPDNRTLLFISSRGGGRDIYSISVVGEVENRSMSLDG